MLQPLGPDKLEPSKESAFKQTPSSKISRIPRLISDDHEKEEQVEKTKKSCHAIKCHLFKYKS